MLIDRKAPLTVPQYFALCFIPSGIYAVMRYNVIGDTPLSQLPLWINNKALGLTATLLIGLSVVLPSRHPRRRVGLLGLFIAMFHAILSITLLSPHYYQKFYLDNGQFSLAGGITILAGVIGFAAMVIAASHGYLKQPTNTEVSLSTITNYVLLALIFNILHILSLESWFSPTSWPGYLPPISIIGAIVCFYVLVNYTLNRSHNIR